MTAPSPRHISLGEWNRTLLHRQHLLRRVDEDAIEVIDRCVGLQSQDPRAAHYGLWSRIADYDPHELDELLTSREVVRMSGLRGTVFLADAIDSRWIRELAQPIYDAALGTHARRLVAAAPAEVIAVAETLLRGTELAVGELSAALQERWPDEPAATLTAVARFGLELVQVPPRGLWGSGSGGAVRYRLLDDWVEPAAAAVTGDDAVRDLIRLYLRGFGPSTANGVQSWSGLRGLTAHLDAMVDDWELVEYVGPYGEKLYDLDGLDIVAADEPAPARLIAPYDNVIFARADRLRIADPEIYAHTVTPNGRSPGFVLAHGRLAGTWRVAAQREVVIDYLVDVDADARAELALEVEALESLLR